MFDVRIINDEAVLFENDIEVMNLEYLRKNGDIRYDFPDGSCVAISRYNTIRRFDSDGNYHRDGDMPAYITTDGCVEYWKHGRFHRECGPARIWPNGKQEYWLDDIAYIEKEFDAEMAKRNTIKDAIDVLKNANLDDTETRALNILLDHFS